MRAHGFTIALTLTSILAMAGRAQSPPDTIEGHVAAARAAAGQHHQVLLSQLCAPGNTQPAAARPAAAGTGRDPGPKAIGTPATIRLARRAREGLRQSVLGRADGILGVGPDDIGGNHHHRRTPTIAGPKRDLIATDNQKLTLGDTTVTLYVTPVHTPGTMSFLIPVTDHSQRHLVAEWGGTQFRFTPTPENFRTYAASAERFRGIVAKAGADALIANHPELDDTKNRLAALAIRKPGDANPYVIGTDAVVRYLTVAGECVKAAGLAQLGG